MYEIHEEGTNIYNDMSNVLFLIQDGRSCEVIFFIFDIQEIYSCTPQYNTFQKLKNMQQYLSFKLEENITHMLFFLPHFHVFNIKIPLAEILS